MQDITNTNNATTDDDYRDFFLYERLNKYNMLFPSITITNTNRSLFMDIYLLTQSVEHAMRSRSNKAHKS